MSEADGHLQQKLKQLLKLSKEKWEAACEHAKTAVQVNASKIFSLSCKALGIYFPVIIRELWQTEAPLAF